jgi:hypothetical protein
MPHLLTDSIIWDESQQHQARAVIANKYHQASVQPLYLPPAYTTSQAGQTVNPSILGSMISKLRLCMLEVGKAVALMPDDTVLQ